MRRLRQLFQKLRYAGKDENFLYGLNLFEGFVSKVLSLVMVVVILVALNSLVISLVKEITNPEAIVLSKTLFKIFGLFLNILIALEILENITAYLRKHVIQLELVVVTSLIAVARKIIILDLKTTSGSQVIGLAIAIISLSISYWIIRSTNTRKLH